MEMSSRIVANGTNCRRVTIVAIVTIPIGTTPTLIAENVNHGTVYKMHTRVKYSHDHVPTGDSAPVSLAGFVEVRGTEIEIKNQPAIDVYMIVIGSEAGRVRVDT